MVPTTRLMALDGVDILRIVAGGGRSVDLVATEAIMDEDSMGLLVGFRLDHQPHHLGRKVFHRDSGAGND
jgi:hypothetical protein